MWHGMQQKWAQEKGLDSWFLVTIPTYNWNNSRGGGCHSCLYGYSFICDQWAAAKMDYWLVLGREPSYENPNFHMSNVTSWGQLSYPMGQPEPGEGQLP